MFFGNKPDGRNSLRKLLSIGCVEVILVRMSN